MLTIPSNSRRLPASPRTGAEELKFRRALDVPSLHQLGELFAELDGSFEGLLVDDSRG